MKTSTTITKSYESALELDQIDKSIARLKEHAAIVDAYYIGAMVVKLEKQRVAVAARLRRYKARIAGELGQMPLLESEAQ